MRPKWATKTSVCTPSTSLSLGEFVLAGASFETADNDIYIELLLARRQNRQKRVVRKDMTVASKIWTPDTWKDFPAHQQVHYQDTLTLKRVLKTLRQYPPLVFVGEIDTLKKKLADASYGKCFLLQGGDCAESFSDCKADIISNKVKILLQMASVLCYGLQKPVICVARMAGQFTKPRSQSFEIVGGTEIPAFRGESINSIEATLIARQADPFRLARCYHSSALTLNFIRSLASGGFADFHRTEQWELEPFRQSQHYGMYKQVTENLQRAINLVLSLGGTSHELRHMNFFTCHEGLHLNFEQALTHYIQEKKAHYNLNAHMLWIGDRTRQLNGAHVEYFRGIANPIGIKIGPSADPDEILKIIEILNPQNEAGRITLIPRLGERLVTKHLPPLIRKIKHANKIVLWSCDPMHGNTIVTATGVKTRIFSAILNELLLSFRIHKEEGSFLGGVHFELTGENVSECLGGMENLQEKDLDRNYRSFCDPRLNYQQSLELAFTLAALFESKGQAFN